MPLPCMATRRKPRISSTLLWKLRWPKGRQLTQAIVGTFDSLNPFIVKGIPADGIRGYVMKC